MSNNDQTYRLSVNASTKHLAEVRNFVAKHADRFGFPDNEINDIRLAVDEAYTNIIKHAYKFDETKQVEINLGKQNNEFWISLYDNGESFDSSTYEKPDVKQKIKNKKRGGVGVYLIKKLMDDVEYRHQGKRNEIHMKKKLH